MKGIEPFANRIKIYNLTNWLHLLYYCTDTRDKILNVSNKLNIKLKYLLVKFYTYSTVNVEIKSNGDR